MGRFFEDPDFEFDTLIALGSSTYGAGDAGEVLAAIDGVADGDHGAWVEGFAGMGRRLGRDARVRADAGHVRGAALAHLRASHYLSLAQAHADGVDAPGLFARLYEEHRAEWDAFVALHAPPIQPLQIPYDGGSIDGWLFRASIDGGRRRTLIFNNGSDGPVTAAWMQGVAEALARGWNAITFDGPGQNSSLVRHGLRFRHDWEAVMTPVVDHAISLPEVDPGRLALLGVSQAGYWVPRALAFEHRFAAAVADPGVVDVSASFLAELPDEMRSLLDAGDRERFDAYMAEGARGSAHLAFTMAFRFRPYGSASPFDVYTLARRYRLEEDTIAQIQTPLLVTDPDDEQFWPGQSATLHDSLQGPKTLVRFTREEGANHHCEVAGNAVRNQRIFDWLDELVAPDRARPAAA